MPPTNETPHGHARKTSPVRRKAKPKFEVPAGAGSAEPAAAWVYRAEEMPATAPLVPETGSPMETGARNAVLVASMGFIFLGVGTIGLMSVAAIGIIAAPFRFAGSVWD